MSILSPLDFRKDVAHRARQTYGRTSSKRSRSSPPKDHGWWSLSLPRIPIDAGRPFSFGCATKRVLGLGSSRRHQYVAMRGQWDDFFPGLEELRAKQWFEALLIGSSSRQWFLRFGSTNGILPSWYPSQLSSSQRCRRTASVQLSVVVIGCPLSS